MLPMVNPVQEKSEALRSVRSGAGRAHGSPRGRAGSPLAVGRVPSGRARWLGSRALLWRQRPAAAWAAESPGCSAPTAGRLGTQREVQAHDGWHPCTPTSARHEALGPHCTGVDVLGVVRTGCSLSPESSLLIQGQRRSDPEPGRQGTRLAGSWSLTWGRHVSPSGTPAGPARGRLRSFSPVRGFLFHPVLARPGFLGTRRRAGLSVGAANPRLMGLLALVGLAVTDLQEWPSRLSALTSMVLGADRRRRPCQTLARSQDSERPEP